MSAELDQGNQSASLAAFFYPSRFLLVYLCSCDCGAFFPDSLLVPVLVLNPLGSRPGVPVASRPCSQLQALRLALLPDTSNSSRFFQEEPKLLLPSILSGSPPFCCVITSTVTSVTVIAVETGHGVTPGLHQTRKHLVEVKGSDATDGLFRRQCT